MIATRRTFLRLSSAALGGGVLSGPSMIAFGAGSDRPKAKLYTILFDIAPSRDDSSIAPMSNQQIVERLERECGGVEFVVRDLTRGVKLESVLNEAKELKSLGYDGVIVYGWPRDYDLLRTGLPTINIAVVNDFMNVPYPLFKENRVAGAFLDPWGFSADDRICERMFSDLVEKVKLIRTLKRMKSEHILTVTDSAFVNVIYGDVLKHPPAAYNETILGAIDRTFGTRVTKIGTKEVAAEPAIEKLWYSESQEANRIAERWIQAAEKVTYTIESEVVRSAKLYLAMKFLLEKYEATAMAFHIRSLIREPKSEELVYPALATSEFQLENKVVKCQSHLNVVLSEMILQYAYNRPSMLGDYSVDTYNNVSCVQHCEGPWNPWGDERRVPYILTDHRERRIRGRAATGVGAASWVLYPAGEPVTMWQVDVLNKEVLMHTGTTVPMLTGPVKFRDHLWEMM
ncbi:MAG: hypothetical protein KIT09_32810 [Bryobacteraceae bacterium]|nr:hypothetical protein [Bryobacteraceae bacterium]